MVRGPAAPYDPRTRGCPRVAGVPGGPLRSLRSLSPLGCYRAGWWEPSTRLLLAEQVADPGDALDVRAGPFLHPELPPHVTQVRLQERRLAAFEAPGVLDQPLRRDHVALVGGQQVENAELERRQPDRPTAARHLVRLQ